MTVSVMLLPAVGATVFTVTDPLTGTVTLNHTSRFSAVLQLGVGAPVEVVAAVLSVVVCVMQVPN